MVKLKEYVYAICNNNEITIISLDKIYKIINVDFEIIKKLKEGTLNELDIQNNLSFLEFLREKRLIIENYDYSEANYVNNLYYYEGYCDNPIVLDESFQNYSIGIIGCGGVGSVILDQIVALNIYF